MSNKVKALLLFILSMIVILVLTNCAVPYPSEFTETGGEVSYLEVEWKRINPPPGEEGPCFVFVEGKITSEIGYSYGGVWCVNNK